MTKAGAVSAGMIDAGVGRESYVGRRGVEGRFRGVDGGPSCSAAMPIPKDQRLPC